VAFPLFTFRNNYATLIRLSEAHMQKRSIKCELVCKRGSKFDIEILQLVNVLCIYRSSRKSGWQ